MNQNDKEVKPITEKRISVSMPIHSIFNWFKDRRIQAHEDRQARYTETVRDYVQED